MYYNPFLLFVPFVVKKCFSKTIRVDPNAPGPIPATELNNMEKK